MVLILFIVRTRFDICMYTQNQTIESNLSTLEIALPKLTRQHAWNGTTTKKICIQDTAKSHTHQTF